jgi:hypothetical protein
MEQRGREGTKKGLHAQPQTPQDLGAAEGTTSQGMWAPQKL